MSPSPPDRSTRRLRLATVIEANEHTCRVFAAEQFSLLQYSVPFKPRADRLTPGQLVASASGTGDADVIVWRWFDAVVVGNAGDQIRMWEPAHGEVVAQPRDAQRRYRPGSRAYLSAGLPGADWWLAGPVAAAEDADVELDEVDAFYSRHGLWSGLT